LEYRDGLSHGLIREWTEEGQLTLQATYKDGKLDGHYQSWWDDGIPKEDGFYVHGRRQKGYHWFRSNGELWRESN
jgi:antitoxin component YwqK of YwqJK toxin-antitoxin module